MIADWMDQIERGRRRRRGVTGVELRGGAAPEMAILGLPGVKKDEIWVGRALRDMRNPPEAKGRWIGAWSDLGTARGGVGPWSSPGFAELALPGSIRPVRGSGMGSAPR